MMIPSAGRSAVQYYEPPKKANATQGTAVEQNSAARAVPPSNGQSPRGAAIVAGKEALKRLGQIECQSCRARKYKDSSNDPSVSFQTPQSIAPQASASVVRSHEQEHVNNEKANAERDGRKIVSQTVQLFTSVCPECGKVYVSGGKTTTISKADDSGDTAGERSLDTPYNSLIVDARA